jgi:hypothetical protein
MPSTEAKECAQKKRDRVTPSFGQNYIDFFKNKNSYLSSSKLEKFFFGLIIVYLTFIIIVFFKFLLF